MKRTCLFLLFLGFGFFGEAIDRSIPFNDRVLRLAFGSCAKQYRNQTSLWPLITEKSPHGWLWLGDAIYARPLGTIDGVIEGYQSLKKLPEYTSFLSTLAFIDGTWDDHDYGINDGGKFNAFKGESQRCFLDFLDIPLSAPRRRRQGVYTSLLIGEHPRAVKVILLDTRYFRDLHYIPSLASTHIKKAAVVAACGRWLTSFLGLGYNYDGDILGEEQWAWLEQELNDSSTSAVTVLASSVQVTTEVPVFESWGHFPNARRRLFQLLRKTKPNGLVLLSGDVHFAQIMGGSEEGVTEVTSSGLTHSVAGSFDGFVFKYLLLPFYRSKHSFQDWMGFNFGLLEISFEGGSESPSAVVAAEIFGAHDGQRRLSRTIRVQSTEDPELRIKYLESLPPLIPHLGIVQRLIRIVLLALPIIWVIQVLTATSLFITQIVRRTADYLGDRKKTKTE